MLPWDHNGECLYCDEYGEHSPDCEWVKSMPNLNELKIGMNKFCGPAVLSILTGKDTDHCARAIQRVAPHYRGEGVNINDLLRALDNLGFNQEHIIAGTTLYGSLTRMVVRDGMYVVGLHPDVGSKDASGHLVCIEVQERKIYFCDNHTKVIMPASQSARLLQRVKYIYRVSKKPDPILLGKTRRTVIEVRVYEKLEYDQPSANTEYLVESKDFDDAKAAILYLKGE